MGWWSNDKYDSRFNVILSLIVSGANVNVQDKEGHTPLHHACRSCDLRVIAGLIAAGADANIKDKNGHTPLNFACASGCLKDLKYIIDPSSAPPRLSNPGPPGPSCNCSHDYICYNCRVDHVCSNCKDKD